MNEMSRVAGAVSRHHPNEMRTDATDKEHQRKGRAAYEVDVSRDACRPANTPELAIRLSKGQKVYAGLDVWLRFRDAPQSEPQSSTDVLANRTSSFLQR